MNTDPVVALMSGVAVALFLGVVAVLLIRAKNGVKK